MQLRAHYQHDLAELQRRLMAMGELVQQATARALWALSHRDAAAAREVVAQDTAIDDLRYEIEEQALQLIARQQPAAGDLRTIMALTGLASELERMGDYAEGIAEIALRSASLSPLEVPASFHNMIQLTRGMLVQAMLALVERNGDVAAQLERADDEVDTLYQATLASLLALMREQPIQSEAATYLLWAAHNLERLADRAVNIAERTAFIVTGKLNPDTPRRRSVDGNPAGR